ncbi:MAG TPA: N-acetyl-alpha-D-glucosaminyl L-malate synthase BshA [Chthoniobacterales bacterium]|nr:N-acetyl-alpha-D-glucosaminyl L-malate synthase BshA [Chthoniobacterales bacterium]
MSIGRPLRVGITCYPLVGGSGILATALGSRLARRGHQVHFFSSAKPVRLDVSQPGIFFHEVLVNEYRLFQYPDYTLPLAVKMANVARERHLDIFHVHYAVPHATAAYLAVQMLGGPAVAPKIVTTLHGTDATLLGQDPSYREAIEHALSQSDAITTVSNSLRRETLATFQLSHAVDVIPNFFIPSDRIRPRAEVRRDLGIGEDEFLIVHASNVRPLKRIDLLLQAFAAMRVGRRTRLLILAGDTFAPHQHLLDESPARDRVIVCEDVLNVEDYLGASDAGLYTSETESFGLSILETQFHGKPVVAFRVGGIPEVVIDGDMGFLHPFGDVETLAASLDQLAASPELAGKMGEAAQQQARARFSADLVVPRYEHVYERLMLKARAGQPSL